MKRKIIYALALTFFVMTIISVFLHGNIAKAAAESGFDWMSPGQPTQKADKNNPPYNSFEIHLQSRRFTPPQDIAGPLQAQVRASPHERVHVIMQFHDIPNFNERRFLKEAKTKLLHYLPHKAWFASVPRAITENALMNSNVRWIGLILPEDKIFSTLLSQGVSSRNTRPDGSVNLEVSFFKDVSLGVARNLIGRMGGVITKEVNIFHRFTIQISPDRIMNLAQEDVVRWIMEERPPPIVHNDGSRANIGVDPVHEAPYNLSGAGVDVGIWDGGDVDSNHDDFGARVTLVENVGVSNHSTHVAGTMGGDGTLSASNGGTALQWKGIAPGIDIISHDFFDNLVEHNNAINVLGVDLSQNSWGFNLLGPPPSPQFYGAYTLDAPEYDDIITGLYGKRITVVFSAGNDRNDVAGDFDTIGPPGTGKNIITVGAIHSDDDSMTVFSGFGPMDDGRIKPDVVAPGDELGGEGFIKSTLPGNVYGGPGWVGTSMAAPVVSGSAALIIEDFRNIFSGLDPLPSTVKALLIHEAKDLGNIGPDYSFGFGGIQIKDSIDKLRTESIVEDDVGHQATDLYNLNVPAGTTEVKITLVWDDEPAVDAAGVTLVNDLDLIVTDPNSVRHFPWTLDPANPANPAVRTTEDHVNIAEQVSVTSEIISGNWTIEVFGFNVPVAPQMYSLVFTPNFGANVTGKIYFDSSFTQEETFFDLNELVFIEAFVTSLGTPLTGATVMAELKLDGDDTTVANIGLVNVGGGFYRNSWNSTGEAPGVYLLDINVTNPVVVNTREKFHIYPLSGVSAYRFDHDEDGIEDFVLENRHLISVYDGRVNTDRSLLILRQKDTQANYHFGNISDSDVIGRGEVTTSNLKGIKFHSFDFSDSGENRTSVNLNMITEVSDPTEELITFYDTTNGATNDARVFVDNGQWLAQRFDQTDLDEDFTLSRVSVFVDSGRGASNPIIVEIRTDTGGLPSSTVLASESVPAASVPTTADWVDAVFATPAQLLQGGLYWLVLRNVDGRGGGPNFVYTWTADTTSPTYPGPIAFSSNQGSSWLNDTGDFFFRAFGFPSAITTIFDLAITMNSENVDYLVYRLFNFDEFIDDINNIFIPLSGSLGPSTGDDRYHIGNGTDDAVSGLSSNTWTNFSGLTDSQKYVALYDDSNSFDDVNDNVLSLVFFPNTNTLPAQDVGAWFETDRDALRFRYDTTGATTSDEAEYILVFSQGNFSIIDQWMTSIAGGTLPSPNFRTPPTSLSLFVSPNTWNIGSVAEGQSNQSSLFTVTNNGEVAETFTLNIAGPSSPSLWLAGSTAGLDVYVIRALFGSTTGDPTGLFSSDDIILIGSPSPATEAQFGDTSLASSGVSVEVSGERGLWLNFQAPSSTGAGGSQQSFTVTIGAQEP